MNSPESRSFTSWACSTLRKCLAHTPFVVVHEVFLNPSQLMAGCHFDTRILNTEIPATDAQDHKAAFYFFFF